MEHLGPIHSKISTVIVTTPQAVALLDAMKCLSFTQAVNIPVLGLIENMSGYVCPCCGEISNVFSTGGGKEMARREGLTYLGSLPVDTELVTVLDGTPVQDDAVEGTRFALQTRYASTSSAKLFQSMTEVILQRLKDIQNPSDQ
jgi:MinD-like ATPase involved in chromosome partitioning or flagellar assembly